MVLRVVYSFCVYVGFASSRFNASSSTYFAYAKVNMMVSMCVVNLNVCVFVLNFIGDEWFDF